MPWRFARLVLRPNKNQEISVTTVQSSTGRPLLKGLSFCFRLRD
jgi:hypothetical protein